MNANELADAIQYCGDGGYNIDAATMLRQQAKCIEELEKENENWKQTYIKTDAKNVELELLISNNNVTAYKELSDDEIDEVFEASCSEFKLLENGKTKGVLDIYVVARNILKKAREKC